MLRFPAVGLVTHILPRFTTWPILLLLDWFWQGGVAPNSNKSQIFNVRSRWYPNLLHANAVKESVVTKKEYIILAGKKQYD